jgi:hypothetical protein
MHSIKPEASCLRGGGGLGFNRLYELRSLFRRQHKSFCEPTMRPLGTYGQPPLFLCLGDGISRRVGVNDDFVRVLDASVRPLANHGVFPHRATSMYARRLAFCRPVGARGWLDSSNPLSSTPIVQGEPRRFFWKLAFRRASGVCSLWRQHRRKADTMASKKQIDQAIGSWEAACLMGVHWTTPARMVEKGLLTTRTLASPVVSDPARVFTVYSLAECEKDWSDYSDKLKEGGSGKRPRASIDLRPPMVKALAEIENQIAFGDAVSTGEAAEIMGVHWTFPPRMAQQGKIAARILVNARNNRSRCWIFSRASCEANVSTARRLQAAGKKKGRNRNLA